MNNAPSSPSLSTTGTSFFAPLKLGTVMRYGSRDSRVLGGRLSQNRRTNTPVAVVKKWVGHVDQRVIEIYTHVRDEASRAAIQRLDAAHSSLHVKKESQARRSSAQTQHSHKEGKRG